MLLKIKLANKLNMKAISCKQKVREQWLKNGDRSTKYFQYLANDQRRSNYVEELLVDNNSFERNTTMRAAVKAYFQNLYTEDFSIRPKTR